MDHRLVANVSTSTRNPKMLNMILALPSNIINTGEKAKTGYIREDLNQDLKARTSS